MCRSAFWFWEFGGLGPDVHPPNAISCLPHIFHVLSKREERLSRSSLLTSAAISRHGIFPFWAPTILLLAWIADRIGGGR
jgi:hypothetical protein